VNTSEKMQKEGGESRSSACSLNVCLPIHDLPAVVLRVPISVDEFGAALTYEELKVLADKFARLLKTKESA
jgi:hypothetical protein